MQHSRSFFIVPRLSSDQAGMLDLLIAIIVSVFQMLGRITNQNNHFSTDFKIRFKKFGIAIDPKGRSGLSYRRRSDELPQANQVTRLAYRNLVFQNKKITESTELDLRKANHTTALAHGCADAWRKTKWVYAGSAHGCCYCPLETSLPEM